MCSLFFSKGWKMMQWCLCPSWLNSELTLWQTRWRGEDETCVVGKLCHKRAQSTMPLLPLGCWCIFKRPAVRNRMWWKVTSSYSVIAGFNEKYFCLFLLRLNWSSVDIFSQIICFGNKKLYKTSSTVILSNYLLAHIGLWVFLGNSVLRIGFSDSELASRLLQYPLEWHTSNGHY